MAQLLSRVTTAALSVVGLDIRLARQDLGWTVQELADRAGVNARTVRAVEAGAPTTAVGTVFELSWLVGLQLLGYEDEEMPAQLARYQDRVRLAPKRVRTSTPTRRPDF